MLLQLPVYICNPAGLTTVENFHLAANSTVPETRSPCLKCIGIKLIGICYMQILRVYELYKHT